MTAADVTGWLERLEETRDAIGDSPAFRVVGFDQGADEPEWVYARFDDGGQQLFAECYGSDAAAVITASLNALPQLVAAVRGVLALHEPIDDGGPNSGHCAEDGFSWPCPTVSAVAAALGAEVTGR